MKQGWKIIRFRNLIREREGACIKLDPWSVLVVRMVASVCVCVCVCPPRMVQCGPAV